jgi:hypothetical protein
MEPIDYTLLKDAIVIWTGWKKSMSPVRDDALLAERYGKELAAKLLVHIQFLIDEFYESDAWRRLPHLSDIGRESSREFKEKHPELPPEIAEAFSWCYTFDYK